MKQYAYLNPLNLHYDSLGIIDSRNVSVLTRWGVTRERPTVLFVWLVGTYLINVAQE